MNDFLQSLRNGQAEKPRTPKTRKNSDNPYQYASNPRFNSYGGGSGYQNTRNQQMKRPPSQGMLHQGGNQLPAEDMSITLLADILDNLSNHVETLVKNQEYMVNIQARTADILERQTNAIEQIVNHLNLPPEMDMEADLSPGPQIDMEAQPAFENHYVTSRRPEDTMEDNRGNNWTKPITAPVVKPVARPAVKPIVKPVIPARVTKEKEPKKNRVKPQTQKIAASKPVLRKRRKIVEKEKIAPKTITPELSTSTKPADAKLMPRDTVMNIIQSMREEGATFDQVAKRLVELKQPTFSGRGEWHAQTIHRLCSKK
ncbi:MAG: hypothetical protein GY710_07165 [Desulfobacteraceae bacterium]|nr:hypothetical protein [Desulfobacteraceae bacterium]